MTKHTTWETLLKRLETVKDSEPHSDWEQGYITALDDVSKLMDDVIKLHKDV